MNSFARHAIALAAAAFATQAAAQVTLFEREGFDGTANTTVPYSADTVSGASLVIQDSNMWEVCDGFAFRGRCTRLNPGQYPTLASMGHRHRIASVRMVNAANPDTPPAAALPPAPRTGYRDERREERREYRRRSDDRY